MANYTPNSSVRNLPALLQNVTVLVVDPDPFIANIVKHVLENIGFGSVCIEHSYAAGFAHFQTKGCDFIITDFDTQPIEGEPHFITFVRSPESSNPYVPIILLTGHTERQDVEAARDLGITEFVAKPFTARSLCDRIVRVIENPRSFIITKRYTGPDRRRRDAPPASGIERRKKPESRSSALFERLLGRKET